MIDRLAERGSRRSGQMHVMEAARVGSSGAGTGTETLLLSRICEPFRPCITTPRLATQPETEQGLLPSGYWLSEQEVRCNAPQ